MPFGQFNRATTLLLICDVQERFRSAIYGFEPMTNSIVKLLKAAQIPTLTTEQNPKALGPTIPEIANFTQRPLHLGTFSKTKFSMLTEEVFKEIERDGKQFEDFIIVGIEASLHCPKVAFTGAALLARVPSHVCVLQTALQLLGRRGTKPGVHIVADAISSCNPQEVPIALRRIERAGGSVTTSESILFQLMGDASDPAFKPISAIIKEEKANTKKALQALVQPSAGQRED